MKVHQVPGPRRNSATIAIIPCCIKSESLGMLARPQTHVPQQFDLLRNPAVRIGLLAGGGLSLAFSGWIYLANRIPVFDRVLH